MGNLPDNLPDNAGLALAYLVRVVVPTIDDLKLMVLVEAGGQCFYDSLADAAPTEEVEALLRQNGREELGHAHRVRRVIEELTGEPFTVPAPGDNPYFRPLKNAVLSKPLLDGIAGAEAGGDRLYGKWADGIGNEKAAELLRLNGKEETLHGQRVQKVAELVLT